MSFLNKGGFDFCRENPYILHSVSKHAMCTGKSAQLKGSSTFYGKLVPLFIEEGVRLRSATQRPGRALTESLIIV